MEHFDIVIVGAGIWGLSAARTFLTINPSLSLIILDSKQSIGGVWSTEQIYPGLRTNSIQGFFEFSDYPILEADVGVEPRKHINAQAMHDYLQNFADRFDLTRRTRLGVRVLKAVEEGDQTQAGWQLEMGSLDGKHGRIRCVKLVLATGQLSTPYKPVLRQLSSFQGPIIHTVDLGREALSMMNDDQIQTVAVVGGAKSAHDAVYMFARAGKHVKWIIHSARYGRGPVPMAKAFSRLGPWTVFVEAVLMFRPFTWFSPAPWSDGDGFGWVRWFLHSTRLGNKLVQGYFANMANQGAQESGILTDESTKELLPNESAMWYGTQVSSLNYDTDFYELVRKNKVSVTQGNIDHLNERSVSMQDGAVLAADAIVLATGYDYSASVPLEPTSKLLGWGCPVDPSEDDIYPDLDSQSDKEIFARYLLLGHSPSKPERLPALTPWRLWRFLAPPSQVRDGPRNLVFLNAIACYQTCIRSELTSLWAYAYLYDRLTVATPTNEEVRREVSLWTRFGKWRAPYGMQGKMTDLLLDSMPYYDVLLRDLGLQSWRKGWGWIGETCWQAYTARDYKGIIQEWIGAQKNAVKKDKLA